VLVDLLVELAVVVVLKMEEPVEMVEMVESGQQQVKIQPTGEMVVE
jgi:hypothetical protein